MKAASNHDTLVFLTTMSGIFLIFGAIIALYDLTNNAILSALASIISLSVGAMCGIVAGGLYLNALNGEHHD